MIEINVSKLATGQGIVEKLKDGSIRIIKYEQEQRHKEDLVELVFDRYHGPMERRYELYVHLPRTPKPETIVTVSHTSANCWRLMIITPDSAVLRNVGSLGEANVQLRELFEV